MPATIDISNVLGSLAQSLNSFLKTTFSIAEDAVVVSSLTSVDGTVLPATQGKIVVTLVGLEQGTVALESEMVLYALFLANRPNYPESLKFLSYVLRYMADNPIRDAANTPGLDPSIATLKVEFVNLAGSPWAPFAQTSAAIYLPSVLYRLTVVGAAQPATHSPLPLVASA
jgi:hypothetical protein